MNKFAWNITLDWNKLIKDLGFNYVENISLDWNKVLYISWETDKKTSEELIDYFIIKLWELTDYDISISTEDKIELVNSLKKEWLYELSTYEWEGIDFKTIAERFQDFDWVISIREAEVSNKFGNKVIKVDFVY